MSRRASSQCAVLVAIILSGTDLLGQTSATTQPATIDRDVLARNVLRAYRTAKYLKFNMDVTAEPYKLHVEVEMAPRRLLTQVWQNGETFAVAGLSDGVCWEYRPRWKDAGGTIIRNARVEYESPSISGSGNMLLGEHEDCLYGTLLRTWVGRFSDSVTRGFADRIRAASILRTGEAGGMACWVVTTREAQFNGYFEQTYWFDQTSFLLRRWETRDIEDGKLTLRNREYSQIEVHDRAPIGVFAAEGKYRTSSARAGNIPALRAPIRIGSLPRLKPW